MGVVNGQVTSLPSNLTFPHKMTWEQSVTNWFKVYSNRNIMRYIILSSKDLAHVKRKNPTQQNLERFMKVVDNYAHAEIFWM